MTSFPPKTVSRPALLVNGSDEVFRALVDDLAHFASRLQQIRDALARHMGVSTPQYMILMAISRSNSGISFGIKDLSRVLRVSVPFAVNETKKLEQLGLVVKLPVANDKRKVAIVLTEQGRSAVELISPLQRKVNDTLFESLDEYSFQILSNLTGNLLASSNQAQSVLSE